MLKHGVCFSGGDVLTWSPAVQEEETQSCRNNEHVIVSYFKCNSDWMINIQRVGVK